MNIAHSIVELSRTDSLNRDHFKEVFSETRNDDEIKNSPSKKAQFIFEVKAHMIPHPQKKEKGGEDAIFISNDRKAIGIADGVGGWTMHGIDPAVFAQTLMRESKNAYEQRNISEPHEVLRQAYHKTQHIPGSSTACILIVDDKKLKAVNIGDSGFMLVRGNSMFYRTKEQLHSFNYPFQLGTASESSPEDAVNIEIELREDDILIAGSDGLFDNLFDEEIMEIVRDHKESNSRTNLAESIAKKAYHKSESDAACETPFRRLAHELGLVESPFGGKLDDISVLVAFVKPQVEISMKE